MSYMIKLLNNLRVNELKDICRDYEISGYSNLTKAEIISLIAKTLPENNIQDILKKRGLIEDDIIPIEDIKPLIETGREVDNRTYLMYLMHSLNVNELKQVCRDFQLSGYSGLKKTDLIQFILDSLAEEEYIRFLYERELEIINKEISTAIDKIQGNERESIDEIKIVNPDLNEIEITFKGFNWETVSFLSITDDNIDNPDRDCDCRTGSNMGFCSHFWVGFIFSLKEGYFGLSDWSLTQLPKDFEQRIKSIQIKASPESTQKEEELILIDKSTDSSELMEYLDSRITVYESEIEEIEKKTSEFQDIITTYYLLTLKDVTFGPQLKKKSEYDESNLKTLDKLVVRISDNAFDKVNPSEGDKITLNGTVNKDNFLKMFLLKRATKLKKL
ncbi:MAG: Rho termination factor N-terminal domain-containing protein [Promethearchaeati archaeon]